MTNATTDTTNNVFPCGGGGGGGKDEKDEKGGGEENKNQEEPLTSSLMLASPVSGGRGKGDNDISQVVVNEGRKITNSCVSDKEDNEEEEDKNNDVDDVDRVASTTTTTSANGPKQQKKTDDASICTADTTTTDATKNPPTTNASTIVSNISATTIANTLLEVAEGNHLKRKGVNNNTTNTDQKEKRLRLSKEDSSSPSKEESSSPSLFNSNMKRSDDDGVMIDTVKIETILDLPDDPISSIFQYVGPGEFLYMAGVCKRFAKIYKTTTPGDPINANYNNKNKTETSNGNKQDVKKEGNKKEICSTTTTNAAATHNNSNNKKNTAEEETATIVPYTKTFRSKCVESISRVQHWLNEVVAGGSTLLNLRMAANCASRFGQIEVLDFIMAQRPTDVEKNSSFSLWEDECTACDLRNSACEGGQVDVLKHSSRKSTINWNSIHFLGPLEKAAAFQQLDCIRWLLQETNCRRHRNHVLHAAFEGNLEVVRCLVENGCPFDKGSLLSRAVAKGHLHIIKYAKIELNSPWFLENSLCSYAAKQGYFDCLRWMIQNGCAWNRTECREWAQGQGHMDIVRWIDDEN